MMSEPRHTALRGFAVRAGIHFSVATGFDCGPGQYCVSDYDAAKGHARTCRVPWGARAPQLCSLLDNLMLAARRRGGDWVEWCQSELTRQKTDQCDQAAVSHWSVLDNWCQTEHQKNGIRFRTQLPEKTCAALDQLALCLATSSRTSGTRSTGTSIAV